MVRGLPGTRPCTRADARERLRQAQAYIEVARLCADDDSETATDTVVASLAVLAGIAAADSACCAGLKVRARGQSHAQASALVRTIDEVGPDLADLLDKILDRKDDAHYGLRSVDGRTAASMLKWAGGMVDLARPVLERT